MHHCCILAQQPWTLLLAGASRDMADKLSIGKVTVRVGGREGPVPRTGPKRVPAACCRYWGVGGGRPQSMHAC